MENVLSKYHAFSEQGNAHLDRQKALNLLREVLEVTKHANITAISINPDGPEDFTLKINCIIDEKMINAIQPIISRDKLAMKQDKGFLTIYTPSR